MSFLKHRRPQLQPLIHDSKSICRTQEISKNPWKVCSYVSNPHLLSLLPVCFHFSLGLPTPPPTAKAANALFTPCRSPVRRSTSSWNSSRRSFWAAYANEDCHGLFLDLRMVTPVTSCLHFVRVCSFWQSCWACIGVMCGLEWPAPVGQFRTSGQALDTCQQRTSWGIDGCNAWLSRSHLHGGVDHQGKQMNSQQKSYDLTKEVFENSLPTSPAVAHFNLYNSKSLGKSLLRCSKN